MDEAGRAQFLEQFTRDLIALGVRPGGVLMVHSALRPFGFVLGGAETIIRGLLAALGSEGTLLMPALSYENVTPENPVFDVRHTTSCVGAIAEAFRRRAGTRRSLHPTHSVCAVGPLTDELLIPHAQDSTPCGPHSPFHRLPQFDGQILMLACSLIYNTSLHAIEEMVVPPYLFNPPLEYQLTDDNGNTLRKMYTPHNFAGWSQRYERVSAILTEPALRCQPVMDVPSYLLEARDLWPAALAALQREPLFFVDEVGL
ncbi:MAG TPA: AAC(3) family N-acetyltransferase [Anaerolineales bacterium]|nr:AAC(3) family N-acetyltransferase [Anaerolineales bacterium]